MRLAVLIIAAVLLVAAPAAAAPQLQVVGNRLVDASSGQAFVPRGVNWPSFEYACFYGYAYSDSAEGGSVNPDAAGAAVIASWHVNTVRVPLNEACWLGVDAQPAFGTMAGYRAAVQQWVATLHGAGLAVILDLHWLAPAGVGAEGQRAMPDPRAADFWSSVAATFKDDRAVMFDLYNEPYSRFADDGTPIFELTWACWRDGGCAVPQVNDQQPPNGMTYTAIGMQQMVAAVRAAGATQPVLLAGRDYANDLGDWLASRPADAQVVASFHNYAAQACNTAACWDSTIAPIAAQVPVVTTEFGQADCGDAHLKAAMDWADHHGVGYLAWAWWVLPDKTCQQLALLADASGTPRAPNGTALKAHLDALFAQSPAAAAPRPVGPGPPSAGQTQASAPGAAGAAPSARVALSGRRAQRLGRTVSVRVACADGCRALATGRLATVVRGRRRSFRLRGVAKVLARGRSATLRLAVPRAARRAAARALRRRGRATATVTVTAASTTLRRQVTLKL